MSDFHLDAFIDDLARSLILTRRDCAAQWRARCQSVADAAAVVAGLPITWPQVVPPRSVQGLDLELALSCELEALAGDGGQLPSLALRVCAPSQGHRLTLGLTGSDPLHVQVRLDGHLLRSFDWDGRGRREEGRHG